MDLIPAPRQTERATGFHELGDGFGIEAGPGTEGTARWLRATLGAATGFALPPKKGDEHDVLHLSVRPGLDAEEYRLAIAPTASTSRAARPPVSSGVPRRCVSSSAPTPSGARPFPAVRGGCP